MTTGSLTQEHFQGRNDGVGLNSATFTYGADTNFTQVTDATFRLRFVILHAVGNSITDDYILRFNLAGGGYTDVTASSAIQWATSSQYSNGDATSQVTSTGGFVAGFGVSGSATTSGTIATSTTNNHTEIEWCLRIDSAQVTHNQTVTFQVWRAPSTVLNTYAVTPTITIDDSAVSFTANPTTGTLVLTGLVSALNLGWTTAPTAGVVAIAGQAATISTAATLSPTAGTIVTAGLAPTVDVGGGALIQRLSPNTVLASSNLKDSASNIPPTLLTDLDDETSGSPGPDNLWWTAVDPSLVTDARVGFPSPPGNLVGTQTIRVLVRGSSLPSRDAIVALYDGGSPAPGSPTISITDDVTSSTGQVVTITFTSADLSDPSGAGVEVRITAAAA